MNVDPERFIEGLHDYLAKAFAPMVARMLAAEARVEALEKRLGEVETATIETMLEVGK